ncbi:P-loop containing nucleoside triphosphate hydrolase protein [Mycena belliarum]|uniref:P-loop containing nucleoside triphosphate hydrolase protein n=1 Tax=Mycena belliarum TaxID=1033014 RepID=A0AAD6UI60_9AGAR|nr:P-loop containing nucleoside triphosphate hydrolase protein [Mycena belliae]
MVAQPFTVAHNIFKAPHPPILVTPCNETILSREIVEQFLATADGGIIGVAPAYGRNCQLFALAFASAENVLVVYLARKPPVTKGKKSAPGARELLEDLILCAESHTKFAFRMDILSTSLYLDYGLRMTGAVDLLSAAPERRHSLGALMTVLGGEEGLQKENLITLFEHEENVSAPAADISLQAWTAWRAATLESMSKRLAEIPRIDTRSLSEARLRSLARLNREARILIQLKPTRVENEVDTEFSCKAGKLQVTSTRFKTRVLASNNQRVEVESTVEGKVSTFSGKTVFVDGRAARIALTSDSFQGDTIRVTTIGRERETRAESQREKIVMRALQGRSTLLDNPFFQALWLPDERPAWSTVLRATHDTSLYYPHATLNDSQRAAVRAILSTDNANRVTVVQGPPGTGKTTVIAAAVVSILSSADHERTVWVVAQSNVAVKNIAEKLADVDCDFALLVSKAAYAYLRHEHLYAKIMDSVVRSDDMTDDIVTVKKQLAGIRVVLCTLSMFSSFRISPITRIVPVQTVMVDEASQVEIGNYVPMLNSFSKSLQKLVLIGDDKQLPPYGQNGIDSLQSVFEIDHLRQQAVFLDTQSCPNSLDLSSGNMSTMANSKVVKGTEVAKGRSWINVAEAQAAIAEARKYHAKGQSYRIITPYDAQRSILESTLKAAKIPWENKVFCVDSFQGNEDDYVILSVVRTENIGFLAEQRRVNVMLSRCRKGMVICTNRTFLQEYTNTLARNWALQTPSLEARSRDLPIGVAPGYSKSGGLVALAIADDTYCLIVRFYSNSGHAAPGSPRSKGRGGKRSDQPAPNRDTSGRKVLEDLVLCRTSGDLLAFDFGPLSMSLYCGVDLRVTNGVDIQSAFSAVDRKPLSAIRAAVGDSIRVFEDNVKDAFENPIYQPDKKNSTTDLAMRAWISQYLVCISNGAETFTKVPKINTQQLQPQTLDILAKSVVMSVQNSRGATYTVHGRSGGVDGRSVNLDILPLDKTKTILKIQSIGRDDPTTAEAQRAAAVLRILQGDLALLTDNPWMKNIWFPAPPSESHDLELLVWPSEWTSPQEKIATLSSAQTTKDNPGRHNLNKSQQQAVDTMLSRSDTDRITIIQGPPGTGKTSVIAAYVQSAIEQHQTGFAVHPEHVDEASQIEIVFTKYQATLRKMCFIGDDKQLPPYGQEDLQDLQSIFEITHLHRLCLFLDTQYRMPPQIGAFISTNIYDGKLKSNPRHPIPDSVVACQFIDVVGSKEQGQTTGKSIINALEAEAVIKLAQHLQEHQKNYKIITPYDAQRVLIETQMQETEGLHWEEKANQCDLSKYVGDIGWLDMKNVISGEFLDNPRKRDMTKA